MIIGKGGSTYKHFTESTGCSMDIPKMATSGCDYREVSLHGLPAQVVACEQLIIAKVGFDRGGGGGGGGGGPGGRAQHGGGGGGEGSVNLEIMVPNDKVGILIGRGGSTIKQLQVILGFDLAFWPFAGPTRAVSCVASSGG